MKAAKKRGKAILWVQILEAKPNKMFTEKQRQAIRFLRYNRHVACAACGKKARLMWTMICQFKAVDFERNHFTCEDFPQSLAPLTPVCSDHPLRPDFGKETP